MKLNTVSYTLPADWASYLVNGDASGLSDAEQKEVDAFCDGLGFCIDCSNENEFSWRNDANNLGGPVADFTFQSI